MTMRSNYLEVSSIKVIMKKCVIYKKFGNKDYKMQQVKENSKINFEKFSKDNKSTRLFTKFFRF